MQTKHWISILKIFFSLFAFALMITIAKGIFFDSSVIKQSSFWVTVLCQLVVVIIIYNLVMQDDIRSCQLNKNGAYYKYRERFVFKANKIYLDRELDKRLDDAIDRKNHEWLVNKQQSLINKITNRLKVSDLEKEDFNFDEFCDKYRISPKDKKKLLSVVNKIISGKVKIHEITREKFLVNKDEQLNYQNRMTFNGARYEALQNVLKIVTFIGTTMLLAMIQYKQANINLFYTIITNATLILGACFSGVTSAKNYIKHMGTSFDERANFLTEYVDIKEEPSF